MQKRQRSLLAAALVAGLPACQGSSGPFAGIGGSPEGVPVAFESIEGAPQPVKTALASELVAAASSRRVDLAGSESPARYRLRGYLSTETNAEGEPRLAFVWDVFDAEKRRAKRLTGSSPMRASAADPWSGLDKETLAKLAAESMDEIAGFLSQSKSEPPTMTAEAVGAAPAGAMGFASR